MHGDVKNPPASAVAPIAPQDKYQYTKFEGEKVALEYIQLGLKIMILRSTAIFGPEDPERWLEFFKRIASGRFYMFGNGIVTYHSLYIDNLTDAFELAMDKEKAIGQNYLIAMTITIP